MSWSTPTWPSRGPKHGLCSLVEWKQASNISKVLQKKTRAVQLHRLCGLSPSPTCEFGWFWHSNLMFFWLFKGHLLTNWDISSTMAYYFPASEREWASIRTRFVRLRIAVASRWRKAGERGWWGEGECVASGLCLAPHGETLSSELPRECILFFFTYFFISFSFFKILKIKLCAMECTYRYYFIVRCRIYRYYFILWGKVVSLSLQRVMIIRQKIGERADVAVIGPEWWAKKWLIIVFALRQPEMQ